MKRPIPPPRPIDWSLRPLESAETELCHLRDGRRELRIRHAPLHGITPAMLRWWFLHIEGTVEVQGRIVVVQLPVVQGAATATGCPTRRAHLRPLGRPAGLLRA